MFLDGNSALNGGTVQSLKNACEKKGKFQALQKLTD